MSFVQKLAYAAGGSLATAAAFSLPSVSAHCQVPCGIFDDSARVSKLLEDAVTISKAQTQVTALAAKGNMDAQGMNQATRWINTKEQHADIVITTVAEYFLTQRVKDVEPGAEGYDDYLAKLARHHLVLRKAMATKQSADPATAANLKAAIQNFAKDYDSHSN